MIRRIFPSVFSALILLGGCTTARQAINTAPHVQLGMTRDDLRSNFGVPVRIEPAANGGENWVYRFRAWKNEPQSSTETTEDFNGKTTTASVSWNFGDDIEERPVHLSSEGFVIKPLPKGKIVSN